MFGASLFRLDEGGSIVLAHHSLIEGFLLANPDGRHATTISAAASQGSSTTC